jgi:hypothetical protein
MKLDKNITATILMLLCGSLIALAINVATTFDIQAQGRESFNHKQKIVSSTEKQFFYDLGKRESSDNYKAENTFGYIGKYQFGEESLMLIGYYKKDNTSKNDWKGEWTGKDGIYSKSNFLNTPTTQDKAVAELAAINWNFAQKKGLRKYIGTRVNGVPITKSGIVAGMHLLGPKRVINFVVHGKNSKDGYGTDVKEYMIKFSGHDKASFA